ncbi:hypothetical protein OIU76_029372 [Salix suchowensis]|nr:hypothetical protein OIU76_029372 [Salix suchowensis]
MAKKSPLPRVSAAAAPDETVLDVAGKILRTGTDYNILPAMRGGGGGITFACTGHKSCPVDVLQDNYEQSDGLPLKFIPANRKKGVVRLSTDLNIKFSGPGKLLPIGGVEVCDDCEVLCRDIGIYVDSEGFRRLALSDVPFKVMFKKF